jgi:hypothetical protein
MDIGLQPMASVKQCNLTFYTLGMKNSTCSLATVSVFVKKSLNLTNFFVKDERVPMLK